MPDDRYSLSVPRFLGHYALGPLLGSGATGMVFEGEDRRDGSRVAIKLLHSHLATDPGFRERFAREAHMVALLRSPYTVRLLDYGFEGGRGYMVMDYVEGQTLADALRANRMGPRRAVRIAIQAARALEEAEARGVVHRDIKPENILLGPGDTVKVSDFGLARQVESARGTVSGAFMGTVLYGAPELASGISDHRSDIYALGATLYEAVAGQPPYSGTVRQVLDLHRFGRFPVDQVMHLPRPLREVIRRCMEKQPDRRYQSAAQLAHALERVALLLDGGLTGVFVPETGHDGSSTRSPRRVLMGSASAGALGVAALMLLSVINGTLHANAPDRSHDDDNAVPAATPVTVAEQWGRPQPEVPPVVMAAAAAVAAWFGAETGNANVGTPAAATSPTAAPGSSPPQEPKPAATPTVTPAPKPAPTPTPTAIPAKSVAAGQWTATLSPVSDTCSGPTRGSEGSIAEAYTLAGGDAVRIFEGQPVKASASDGASLGAATLDLTGTEFLSPLLGGKLILRFTFSGPESATVRREERYLRFGGECRVVYEGAASGPPTTDRQSAH
ncbi:MAG: serine/threonine protein kinase [Chloroflexi bacterium]|nr:serine/threonine protein kinase [Chloroflexota bacterium]